MMMGETRLAVLGDTEYAVCSPDESWLERLLNDPLRLLHADRVIAVRTKPILKSNKMDFSSI